MSVMEWKRFTFLDLVLCADQIKFQNIKTVIVAHCYNNIQKVFCDALGFIHVFFKNWESISFQSHCKNIKLCALTTERNLLAVLTQNELKEIFVQIFNLDQITKRNGAPSLGASLLNTSSTAKVMKACVLDNAQICIAIGSDKGDILLHRAVVNRDMTSNFRYINVCSRPIIGIEFRRKETINMFVCSDAGIFCYTITDSNVVSESKISLDVTMSPVRACALGPAPESYFLVGRDDAVYCFTNDGRGPCYAIEGKKKEITWFSNNFIVLVHENEMRSQRSSELIVIDVHNKMIVFEKEVPTIKTVIVDLSNCYIITNENEVFILQERDLQSKIRLLLSKNLYDIALRILMNREYDEQRGLVYTQYGDYLLQKGDLNGAIDKYIETVGLINPYCIIRKLLDTRYNIYLAQYLRVLVQSKFATTEYSELLKNCEERLNLPSKVSHICQDTEDLHNIALSCAEYRIFPNMNTFTFLNMLRLGSERICNFLSRLDEEEVYYLFMENGQLLMEHYPRETIEILKLICTTDSVSSIAVFKYPERFIPLLISYDDYCEDFLEHMVAFDECKVTIYNILLELYIRKWQKGIRNAEDIVTFIEEKIEYLSADQLLIICRNYSFWEGVIYSYKIYKQQQLCLRHYIKTCDFASALNDSEYSAIVNPSLWLQAFNKAAFTTNNTVEFINNFLKTMLCEKRQPLLRVLQSVSMNQNLTVLHIKDFFSQEQKHTVLQFNERTTILKYFSNNQQFCNTLLSNLKFNPIEFRSNTCDICKQQLKLPAVYYLCQHCFHKECINAYSENKCVACIVNKKQHAFSGQEHNLQFEEISHSNSLSEAMEYLSTSLCRGLFKKVSNEVDKHLMRKCISLRSDMSNAIKHDANFDNLWIGRFNATQSKKEAFTSKVVSTNPFEDEDENNVRKLDYDANLNPFEE